MTHRPTGKTHAAARAEKVERLVRFILEGFETCQGSAGQGRPVTCHVIAKSPDSAAIEALTAARVRVGAKSIAMRAILASDGGDSGWTGGLDGDKVALLPAGGLLEAHERLIIDGLMMWTGDSLRRDQDKRDAHEVVEGPGATTVRWAMRSFENMWQRAEPLAVMVDEPAAAGVVAEMGRDRATTTVDR